MTRRYGETVAPGFDWVYEGALLHEERSPFQRLEVYQHPHFGRMLILDDCVQTTERDEFCYHEMLVHPALCSIERPRRVLVIGGGDGGTLRHVLMHGCEAVMVEIDEMVTRVSRDLMPSIAGDAFDDSRATVLFEDGAAYVRRAKAEFDAIVVDSTDPVGPALVLFAPEFYAACRDALKPGGIVVTQSSCPVFNPLETRTALVNMRAVLRSVEVYASFVPTYPGTIWSFTVGGDGGPVSATPPADVERRLRERGIVPRLYSPEVHRAAFALPPFVRASLELDAPAQTAPLSRR